VIGARHAQPRWCRRKAVQALAEHRIISAPITTSEIKFSLLIDANYTELAVRTLHSLYELRQMTENGRRRTIRPAPTTSAQELTPFNPHGEERGRSRRVSNMAAGEGEPAAAAQAASFETAGRAASSDEELTLNQ